MLLADTPLTLLTLLAAVFVACAGLTAYRVLAWLARGVWRSWRAFWA